MLTSFKDLECPVCDQLFNERDVVAFQKAEKNKNDSVGHVKRQSKTPKIGVDALGYRVQPQLKGTSVVAWIERHDAKKGKVPLSPKLNAMKRELFNNKKGDISDKIIIFVQFSQSAIAIGTMLEEDKTPYVCYDVGSFPCCSIIQLSKIGRNVATAAEISAQMSRS